MQSRSPPGHAPSHFQGQQGHQGHHQFEFRPAPSWNEENVLNLHSAGHLVDGQLSKDEHFPELWNLLTASRASGEYLREIKSQFKEQKLVKLPQALLEQFQSLECKCFMGLFPEVHRAWITVDNHLFLWNYKDGLDFCVYDEVDQLVLSVALVKPRPHVFVEAVKHVLVIATPVEVLILALTFVGDSTEGELNLVSTGLSVPSDNVNMLKIVGLDNGRIFLCGRDGCLYELIYQADDGWFTRRCSKVNHTMGVLGKMIPSFLKFGQWNALVDIAADSSRNILYTLTENSSIQVYHLNSTDGGQLAKIVSSDKILAEAEALHPRGLKSSKIISIHVVPITESGPVHLVAVTNTGIRLYFSTNTSLSSFSTPQILELLHVRLPPPSFPRESTLSPRSRTLSYADYCEVHTSYYSQGVLLMADSRTEETDTLLGITPDFSQFTNRADRHLSSSFLEQPTSLEIRGKVWAIAEDTLAQRAAQWLLLKHPKVLRNELATQHLLPPRKFLCLSNTGLHILSKLRPVDQLFQLLAEAGGNDSEDLMRFFEAHGEDQACAMCLTLACSSSSHLSSFGPSGSHLPGTPMVDTSIVKWATRIFFKLGGRPHFSGIPSTTFETPGSPSFGYAVTTPEIIYSHSHNAFALYLARLLRPIWSESIIQRAGPEQQVLQVCGMTQDHLGKVEESLHNLKTFLNNNPQFATIAVLGMTNLRMRLLQMQKRKVDEEATKLEQKSLSNLHLLLLRSVEACSFLRIISHQFQRIVHQLTEDIKRNLSILKFKELVTTLEGLKLSKELVSALIQLYTTEDIPTEGLSSLMRENCPTFFSEADSLRFKGHQFLQQAKALPNSYQQREILEKSLQTFESVAEHIQLRPICAEYQSLHFYNGIVRLSLSHAQALDPSGMALSWHNSGRPMGDAVGRSMFEQRMQCYSCVLEALTKLDTEPQLGVDEVDAMELKFELLKAAMDSNDELFHYSLFEWFIERGHTSDLLQLPSPFLENYLKNTKNDFQLLWQFYLRNKKYVPAATILKTFAEQRGEHLNLHERIENLSRANTCLAKAAGVAGEMLQELQEKMEVAKIQLKIFSELKNMASSPEVENAKKELNTQLFNVSDLYNNYAKKFQLWECQLALINCSGHNDPTLVRKLWSHIVYQEVSEGNVTPLRGKVFTLGREYFPSELVFPVGFLVGLLENCSYEVRGSAGDWGIDWVFRTLLEVGVGYPALFDAYNHYVDSKDAVWQRREAQYHLFAVIQRLISEWFSSVQSSQATSYDVRQFESRQIDSAIDKYLTDLSSSGDAGELLQSFKLLQKHILSSHLP